MPGDPADRGHALVLIDDPQPKVRRFTLNRPDKRNALSNELRRQLFDGVREGNADPEGSVMIVRGAGPCFWSWRGRSPFARGVTARPAARRGLRPGAPPRATAGGAATWWRAGSSC